MGVKLESRFVKLEDLPEEISVAIYEAEAGHTCAYALDLTIVGCSPEGAEDARDRLRRCLVAWIAFGIKSGWDFQLLPAPEEYWKRGYQETWNLTEIILEARADANPNPDR